ncbi:ATP-binding cassette domain-containing protein [Listeria booriae]|uniref:ATP-binding cassette domain-containing protein n=1 Tax=Listeria booriae TaxID=1552123 RepID=A0A7X0XQ77_9LIST|nr:ATP-binding cassette domain-containing protein [Listeria booriae]MBC1778688.1 ATP-binding cassette domain-containing protein [Listeria booriae]
MRVEVNNLEYTFARKKLFDGLSFVANSGEFIVIHGASGSGKSTLLNLLSGLLKNQSGSIRVFASDETELNINNRVYRRDYLNYMFQNFALLEDETVEYNLLLPLTEIRMRANEKRNLIEASLDKVGLKNELKSKVATLSGGEQQRIALARIFLKSGDLVIADEPTGNLDEENTLIIIHLLRELQKQGKIIIVVTHNPNFLSYATKVIRI